MEHFSNYQIQEVHISCQNHLGSSLLIFAKVLTQRFCSNTHSNKYWLPKFSHKAFIPTCTLQVLPMGSSINGFLTCMEKVPIGSTFPTQYLLEQKLCVRTLQQIQCSRGKCSEQELVSIVWSQGRLKIILGLIEQLAVSHCRFWKSAPYGIQYQLISHIYGESSHMEHFLNYQIQEGHISCQNHLGSSSLIFAKVLTQRFCSNTHSNKYWLPKFSHKAFIPTCTLQVLPMGSSINGFLTCMEKVPIGSTFPTQYLLE